uniref:Phosphoribosylformylglycinamidine synthase n=1 Tax=Ursus maritimus TaxID=29073 RepID=A0A452USP7_URSMA
MAIVLHFYVHPSGHERAASGHTRRKLQGKLPELQGVKTELCYNVNWTAKSLPSAEEVKKLTWLFGCPLLLGDVAQKSWLHPDSNDLLLEVGPRLNFSTPASTNVVSVCRAAGLGAVDRVETTRRYRLSMKAIALATLHDRMTEQHFPHPIQSFSLASISTPLNGSINILAEGRCALEKANRELGLALDSWDLDFYTKRFQELQRNPSTVEAFDLAQSNSEHSRHWFFKGLLHMDGQELAHSLFESIMSTQASSNPNNVLKFCDNSSAIQGKEVRFLRPEDPTQPSCFRQQRALRHVVFTAETHNFPTGVAPFSGATTGTGGRIRDIQCTGRGAHVVAGTAGYCFGNLHIPGYNLPWEDPSFQYPGNFARPLEVAIEASNGASDYGNKFGEPVLAGFARSLGLQLPDGQRREWIKPIMFSGGIGSMEAEHVSKEPPEPGMDVVKVGGPVYRIGVGGGAASSVQVQGDNTSELDFGAVQRGDPEMEQKMNRVIRACVEAATGNPICSLHDQGAGGNGNVLKELSDPAGAVIYTSRFQLGDPTLNALEIWGAEYQESNALLLRPLDRDFISRVSARERCPACFVGTITGDKRIVLVDDRECPVGRNGQEDDHPLSPPTPVDLELDWVLGKVPRKEFFLQRSLPMLKPLALPPGLRVRPALERVLRLPAVASKRYLTNKPSVPSLCSPAPGLPLPVAVGIQQAQGRSGPDGRPPCSGLLRPVCVWDEAGPRPQRPRVGPSADCAPRHPPPRHPHSLPPRSAGSLVISAYAVCPDITATVTPDLKHPGGGGCLLYVPLCPGQHRLGGTALAQCFSQLGEQPPNLDLPENLVRAFSVTQGLLRDRLLCSGHDVSDGGLITCLLEMAFAGNCGIEVDVPAPGVDVLPVLFAEEPGLVLEVPGRDAGACPGKGGGWEGRSPLSRTPLLPPGGPVPRVAILREEGSNGDREMADAFHLAGFEVWDVTMQDLCSGAIGLDTFRGLAFVGGFSYADVLGSAKGRGQASAHSLPRTFSAAFFVTGSWPLTSAKKTCGHLQPGNGNTEADKPVSSLLHLPVWMEGAVLPVWSAHGEGYMAFSSLELQAQIEARGLAPLHWADDAGQPTEQYPMNPNGSPGGVAGVCSLDGRHLALMPHPERAVRPWQWAWRPPPFDTLTASPWLQLFINARNWTRETGC